MNEPSVLDYVKAKLRFWTKSELHIPLTYEQTEPASTTHTAGSPGQLSILDGDSKNVIPARQGNFPWRGSLAFLLAIAAQLLLEPPAPSGIAAAVLYAAALLLLIWSILRDEWRSPVTANDVAQGGGYRTFKFAWLLAGLVLTIAAYMSFSSHTFSAINLAFWLGAIVCLGFSLVEAEPIKNGFESCLRVLKAGRFQFDWKIVLVLLLSGVVIYFRVAQLNSVPAEMTSDHAEKLQDVQDILNGQYPVYFTRNTGREFFQFYWTALVIKIFNTGLSFLSLKIGMVLAGLLTLPYIYLLGKEFFNRRVALMALAFAGVAIWPNIISRVALRFALYPLFTAPALYYLLKGIRYRSRNDFILAGLAIGLGLSGYSPFRIVPLLAILTVVILLLHKRNKADMEYAVTGFTITGIIAVVVSIPLIRYAIDNPGAFFYRTTTRLSGLERPLSGNPWLIFLDNLKNGLLMFGQNDGNTWLHSIPGRGALDVISAALFYLGLVYLIVRYIRHRYWIDLVILISLPVLMLPSTLSIAFPEENPVLNRTAGAIIPAFLVVAIALDELLRAIERYYGGRKGRLAVYLLAGVLFILSAAQNYRLTFKTYADQYRYSAGNTTEMGAVIRQFIDTVGDPDSAWVVGYPFWVDTRLVSITAGVYPIRDYAVWTDQLEITRNYPAPKLFIINSQDQVDLNILQEMYPLASVSTYASAVPGRDFLVMYVPSE